MFDAVIQFRAGARARAVLAGRAQFREVGTALRRVGIPLHRGMPRSEPLDVDRGMAEPAVHRLQTRRQVAGAVGLGRLTHRSGALRVVVESRCLRTRSATPPASGRYQLVMAVMITMEH